MNLFTDACNKFRSHHAGLFLLRLVMGVIFIQAGWEKLAHMTPTIGYFASIGFGAFFAYLVAILEFAGGIGLIIGWWTRFFSLSLAIIMVFAIILATRHMGFMGSETPLLLIAGTLTVFLSGCGKYSMCAKMHGARCAACKADGKCECQHYEKK